MADEFVLPAPLKATPVKRAIEHARLTATADKIAGAFSFEQAAPDRGFWGYICFTCPCGCGSFSRLPIGLKTKPPHGIGGGGVQATWEWNGDRQRPTLTPSINHTIGNGRSHWHGFLTGGYFRQPNQTVPD